MLVVAAGFVGTLIILRPDQITPGIGPFVVLLAAFFYSVSYITTKQLSDTESANSVVFYMSLFIVIFSAIPALFVWQTPDLADAPLIIGLGTTGYTTHYCVTRAIASADASFIVPFDFLRLPMSAAAGIVLFAEPVRGTTLIGAAVIFGAAYFNTWREERRGGRVIR
jgi:drug/metabolite transporter (DMT)-like permease